MEREKTNYQDCDNYSMSNCCCAYVYDDTDVCSDCKEHCDTACSDCEEYEQCDNQNKD